MAKDKYTAVWVSHSSMSDWLKCPRAYFLKNVYKDPKSGHKINLMSPPLALGQAVHEVIEGLSVLPVDKRFEESLVMKLDEAWKRVAGKKGGFMNNEIEARYKERGKEMLRRVAENPGPLNKLAVKIQMDLPYFWLSEEDNIILCGKIDWLEYLKDKGEVHIIDFKTGKGDEDANSLQLAIYYLLVSNCQKHKVSKASYWYIARSDEPTEQKLMDKDEAKKKVLKIAKEIKLARQLERFKCPHNGCPICKPLERVINGQAEFVGVNEINNDVYVLEGREDKETRAEIL